MKLQETQQVLNSRKTEAKAMSVVDAFDPDVEARAYARKLFSNRVAGWGDETKAMEDCATWTGLTISSFKRIITGETKRPGAFFARCRKGYLDYCARKIAELQKEVELEKARYGHVRIGDLDQEVEALVAKIEAARAVKIDPKHGRQ